MAAQAVATAVQPTDAEIEREIKLLGAEKLREWKRDNDAKRAAEADLAERIRTGAGRVMLYGVTHCYYLGRTAGKSKFVDVLGSTGVHKVALPDPDYQHSSYQFVNHKAWVMKNDLPQIRKQDFYGIEFIEALQSDDGEKNSRSLEKLMETQAGYAWVESMIAYDKRMHIKPPISLFMVQTELRDLRSGQTKAPPIVK